MYYEKDGWAEESLVEKGAGGDVSMIFRAFVNNSRLRPYQCLKCRFFACKSDEFVRRSWSFQHRALRGNPGRENSRESELRVIKSWVSTYFVIGAREIVFCNERVGKDLRERLDYWSENSRCRG